MKPELEQTATGLMNHPVTQKSVATVMFGTSFATAIAWMPTLVSFLTFVLGSMVSISIIRKNRAETKKLNIQTEMLEEKEKKRHEEVEDRKEQDLPLRREGDK